MRVALVIVVSICALAAQARADLAPGPGGLWGGGPPRTLCHDWQGGLGFYDDEGTCRVGWDGIGDPPDAGGLYRVGGAPPPAPPVEERHVHVALPFAFYATLGLALVVGVVLVFRAARKKPPPS